MTQTQKFEQNWQQNHPLFGQQAWEQEPDFCYYIQAPLALNVAEKLYHYGQDFKNQHQLEGSQWLAPEQLALTLTLPGRLGTHFQKNDLPFMKQTLKAITAKTPAFKLKSGNMNVFAHSLWIEIYDASGRLQQLHETLCNEIPFSQHPEFRYQNYLPHISLGYGIKSKKPLKIDTNRNLEPLDFPLDTLELGKAKWQQSQLQKVTAAQFNLA